MSWWVLALVVKGEKRARHLSRGNREWKGGGVEGRRIEEEGLAGRGRAGQGGAGRGQKRRVKVRRPEPSTPNNAGRFEISGRFCICGRFGPILGQDGEGKGKMVCLVHVGCRSMFDPSHSAGSGTESGI